MMRILIAGLPEQTKNYVAAVTACGMDAVVSLKQPDIPTLSGFNGLILPGGSDVDPARYGQPLRGSRGIEAALDDAQFAILDAFVKAEKPILGICKGHQIINIYFGGDLIQDLPEAQSSRHRYDDGDKTHPSHAGTGSWLAKLYGTDFPVNSAHHQAVGRVAQGFHVIQTSDDHVIEAIHCQTRPILSVQWHPERMCCDHRRADTVDGIHVFSYFKKLCEEQNGCRG